MPGLFVHKKNICIIQRLLERLDIYSIFKNIMKLKWIHQL